MENNRLLLFTMPVLTGFALREAEYGKEAVET